jgi:hypothetical protein
MPILFSERLFEVVRWGVGHDGLLLRSLPTDQVQPRIEVLFKPAYAARCLLVTAIGDAVESMLRATERVLIESSDAPMSSTPSSVRDLLAAGEDVVAYEVLCDNLYEVDLRPPVGLGLELRRAVIEAGADPSRADLLLS